MATRGELVALRRRRAVRRNAVREAAELRGATRTRAVFHVLTMGVVVNTDGPSACSYYHRASAARPRLITAPLLRG